MLYTMIIHLFYLQDERGRLVAEIQAVLPKPDNQKYIVDPAELDLVSQTSFASGLTSLATAQVVKLERAYTRAVHTLTKCGLVANLTPLADSVGSATLSACYYGGNVERPASSDVSSSGESSCRESFHSLFGSNNDSSSSVDLDGAVSE